MTSVSVKEARENLRALIDRVAAGEEVIVLRRGKEVARLVPPRARRRKLPGLDALRSSLTVRGRELSAEVGAARREERY